MSLPSWPQDIHEALRGLSFTELATWIDALGVEADVRGRVLPLDLARALLVYREEAQRSAAHLRMVARRGRERPATGLRGSSRSRSTEIVARL